MSLAAKKTSRFLKVKTGIKAGADNDPCASDWYRGYEDGHYNGFSESYYGDRGGSRHDHHGGGHASSSNDRGRNYWLRHRQEMLG